VESVTGGTVCGKTARTGLWGSRWETAGSTRIPPTLHPFDHLVESSELNVGRWTFLIGIPDIVPVPLFALPAPKTPCLSPYLVLLTDPAGKKGDRHDISDTIFGPTDAGWLIAPGGSGRRL